MGTVYKALELLDLFTRLRPRIGLSEVARLSGQNKATCHRLLTELEQFGFVEQRPDTREYRLGPAFLRFAALREAEAPMRDVTRPILQRLAETVGESVHSSMLIADRLQMIDFVYSTRHGTRVMLDDADTLPFHATSSGLAVLPHLPQAFQDRILAGPLPAVTEHTETDPARLRQRIETSRRAGWAEVASGFEADVVGLAVPLFGPRGECLGAVASVVPVSRLTPDLRRTILKELTASATEITHLCGGVPPVEIEKLWRAVA